MFPLPAMNQNIKALTQLLQTLPHSILKVFNAYRQTHLRPHANVPPEVYQKLYLTPRPLDSSFPTGNPWIFDFPKTPRPLEHTKLTGLLYEAWPSQQLTIKSKSRAQSSWACSQLQITKTPKPHSLVQASDSSRGANGRRGDRCRHLMTPKNTSTPQLRQA